MSTYKKVIFISSKRKPSTPIFTISKIKKSKTDSSFLSNDHSESTYDVSISTSQSKQISIDEISIPNFLNDLPVIPYMKTKLAQYQKVLSEFEDEEDTEIYLVRKDTLFSIA